MRNFSLKLDYTFFSTVKNMPDNGNSTRQDHIYRVKTVRKKYSCEIF